MLQRYRIDGPALVDEIAARLAAVLESVGPPRGGLLSVTFTVPEIPFDEPPGALDQMSLWSRPAERHSLLGSGVAAAVEASGAERWSRLRQAYSAWQADWRHLDVDASGLLPLARCGFAFAPDGAGDILPAARLAVPALLLRRRDDITALTFSFTDGASVAAARERLHHMLGALAAERTTGPRPAPLRHGAEPQDDAWLARVAEAVADIQSGRLDKVVLSRRIAVSAAQPLDAARIGAELARRYPNCTLFAEPAEDGSVLLGASPEILVALRHGEARCDALAGTAWGAGGAERETGLLGDVKNGREHRLVVQALAEGLRPVCARLEVPAAPVASHFGPLHHLRSTLRGRVKAGVGLLDLVQRLHPTPAVGGYPRRAALDWLAAHGERREAWYSGAVGWIDSAGEGEFAVALRCALIRNREADLYAGAGIVAGSDPRRELAETEAKLAVMLDAMAAGA